VNKKTRTVPLLETQVQSKQYNVTIVLHVRRVRAEGNLFIATCAFHLYKEETR
jgi:hypothetical protein